MEKQDLVKPWRSGEVLANILQLKLEGLTGHASSFPCPFSPGYTHQKTVTIGCN